MHTHPTRLRPYSAALVILLASACSSGGAIGDIPSTPPPSQPDMNGPPPPMQAQGRLQTFQVFQAQGAQQIEISRYVFDGQLKSPVGIAVAEDGVPRWLPIGDWTPWAINQAQPLGAHSEASNVYLDIGCTQTFAITPQTMRPRFIWAQTRAGAAYLAQFAVYAVGNTDVSTQTMYLRSGSTCQVLQPAQRQLLLQDRGAWSIASKLPPDSFVALEMSATIVGPTPPPPATTTSIGAF